MENFYAGTAAFCPDRLACQRGAAVLYWEKVKGDEPMCDTLGFVGKDRAIFGKNSDRSPNEPQLLEYTTALLRFDTLVEHTFVEGQRLPIAHEKKAMQKLTYCSVEQSGESHAVLLSRPSWMWGAEMGVNDCGLCIGNEAVFTRGKYGKEGLTGMDLVRLALERSDSAKAALELIIDFLERYGQGGNCGYDHEFYYDNSFLLMDAEELYVLETAGKDWAWKKSGRASISNRLSLGADADAYSAERCDFAKKHLEPVYSTFSGSAERKGSSAACLSTAEDTADMMAALRRHRDNVEDPFARGSVDSVCMHFGGLVGDHTTSSMIVELKAGHSLVWATGSSCPCVSLYKPWLFGTEPVAPVFAPNGKEGERYWREQEAFRRSLLGKRLPADYYDMRDALEKSWLEKAESCPEEEFAAFSRRCAVEEWEFFKHWKNYEFESVSTPLGFRSRWEKKNRVFREESKEFEAK